MAVVSSVPITPGAGSEVATYTFSESSKTKHIQRFAVTNPDGVGNAYGAGNAGADVPRVTLAADDPSVVAGEAIKLATEAIQLAIEGILKSGGDRAHDAVDGGNPVKIGGRAYSATPAAVANGDRTDQAFTTRGAAHVSIRDSSGNEIDPNAPAVVDAGVRFVDVTLSTDTSAYAAGDLIADAQVVSACVRSNDANGALHSISLIDESDQKAAFTLYVTSSNASWGTENATPTITDANARSILGFVDFATADYKDLGGVSVAFKGNVGMAITPAPATDDIYIAAVNGAGTPTFAADGLKLRLGFLI